MAPLLRSTMWETLLLCVVCACDCGLLSRVSVLAVKRDGRATSQQALALSVVSSHGGVDITMRPDPKRGPEALAMPCNREVVARGEGQVKVEGGGGGRTCEEEARPDGPATEASASSVLQSTAYTDPLLNLSFWIAEHECIDSEDGILFLHTNR